MIAWRTVGYGLVQGLKEVTTLYTEPLSFSQRDEGSGLANRNFSAVGNVSKPSFIH